MPTEPGAGRVDRIDLLPMATLPAALASRLAERLSRRLTVPCRVLDDESSGLAADGGHPLPSPRVPGREQADADALLAQLEARPTAPGVLLVGATEEDVGNAVFTHFFGRARRHGRAALVSTARLGQGRPGEPPDEERLLRRAVGEVLHELGHLGGLVHCARADCVMHFAPTVEAIDVRGAAWCDACAARLPPGLLPRDARRERGRRL